MGTFLRTTKISEKNHLLVEEKFPIVGIVLNTILYIGAALYRPSLMDARDASSSAA